MNNLFPAIVGWVLMLAATATLLRHRVQLAHYERRLSNLSPHNPVSLHQSLRHKILHLDYWGVSLTFICALYTLALLLYPLYLELARIARDLLQLISVI